MKIAFWCDLYLSASYIQERLIIARIRYSSLLSTPAGIEAIFGQTEDKGGGTDRRGSWNSYLDL